MSKERDARGLSRLGQVMKALGLRPTEVVVAARRIAPTVDAPPISRQHLRRLCTGTRANVGTSYSTVRLLVATFRSLTGLPLLPSHLFPLEPAGGAFTIEAMFGTDAFRVFSAPEAAQVWRTPLTDADAESSAEQVVERLYREHADLLRVTARRRYDVPEKDIDALVHDVFLSYLRRRPVLDDERAFLLGAIKYASLHYWRKHGREAALLPEHESTPDRSTELTVDRWVTRLAVAAMLARLGAKCRETLRGYYLGKRKPDEIARALHTTEGYVFQLLSTCRRRAREIYQQMTRPRS